MNQSGNNIEAVARALCEAQLRRHVQAADLPVAIDRYWHCVAAELEAGLIDTNGNPIKPRDIQASLAAYRDWRLRHPDVSSS